MFSSSKPDPKPCDGCGTPLDPIPLRSPAGHWLSPRTCVTCAERITPDGPAEDPYLARRRNCAGRQNAPQHHIAADGSSVYPDLSAVPPPHQAALHAYLRELVEQTTRVGAYVGGLPGVGKTHLLKALTNALVERRIDVCMINDQALTALLRSTQKPGAPTDIYDLIADLADVAVLIIDDFNPSPGRAGMDADGDFRLTHLYDILNRRYEAAKTTIISSNFALDAMAKVSPKIASRIGHRAWMRYFLVGGHDLRAA